MLLAHVRNKTMVCRRPFPVIMANARLRMFVCVCIGQYVCVCVYYLHFDFSIFGYLCACNCVWIAFSGHKLYGVLIVL